MDALPSYHEATTRLDWLDFVAPYIQFSELSSLCLVSRRFWKALAPLLWADLLTAVSQTGLDPSDHVSWWLDFVFNRLGSVRPETRQLVHVLDTRGFAKDAYDFALDSTFQQSLKQALGLLPNVNCLLLDGHQDVAPSTLIGPNTKPLQLLSISGSPFQLPNAFFNLPALQSLVYLDASHVPGSINPLIQPSILPDLRILKIRGRELDNTTLKALTALFRLRLWSLDIAHNKISDDVVGTITTNCFPMTKLRSPQHFYAEGKLVEAEHGSYHLGTFVFVQESLWSRTFSHPERYLIDAPTYHAHPDRVQQEDEVFRSDGRNLGRRNSAEAASATLSGKQLGVDGFCFSRGLTHLDVSSNQLSCFGLVKLIQMSNGQLEDLTCDSIFMLSPSSKGAKYWPKSTTLYGVVGAAHVFRPVFSSNLRTLRIHHSLVTHIPTLKSEGLSSLSSIYLVENEILPRLELAYGQTFIPDMNPRLVSLTLTGLPRRSSGPLVDRLVKFLKLLSIQERDIQDVGAAQVRSWRGPTVLKGLRHLRLEFEPDPMQDGFSSLDDLDAANLMNSGEKGFSFFGHDDDVRSPQKSPSPVTAFVEARERSDSQDTANSSTGTGGPQKSVRDDQEYITYRGEWNGKHFSISVWIGEVPNTNQVIREYRRLVVDQRLTEGVGPVTPAQVAVGVPPDAYVFHVTWCVATIPKQLVSPPIESLSGMRDVLDELKRYRLAGRARYMELKRDTAAGSVVPLGEPHFFWTGKLQVSTEGPAAQMRPSQYWR
ncbi:unnamed protein product [Clonostachys rosea]|uniref:F-box domain-containing protein n=1 Tax=Bionectria ochroleuca TaxID=29856 RepID=A0ABY6TPR3_BIOOC|nr:unnamed protein product [Clonostachys rosea]